MLPAGDVPPTATFVLELAEQPLRDNLVDHPLYIYPSDVITWENFGLERLVCRWVNAGIVAEVPHADEQ